MRRKSGPSYLLHRQSGRGIVIWRDPTNTRRTKLMPGKFGSSESRAAFGKLQIELAASPTSNVERTDISVAEVFAAYLDYARNYYANADGSPSKELPAIKSAMNPADALYGDLNAAESGPQKLKVVRQKMIESDWCRSLVNRRINCIRRIFKWAVSEELVPVSTFEALRTLAGLRRGRTETRESAPVRPVDPAVVDSTLPYLLRELARKAEKAAGGKEDEHREEMAEKSRARSRERREIGPLPPVKDPERHARCENDTELFARTYFPNRFPWPFASCHRDSMDRMQTCTHDGGQFACAMPRDSGKTTAITARPLGR